MIDGVLDQVTQRKEQRGGGDVEFEVGDRSRDRQPDVSAAEVARQFVGEAVHGRHHADPLRRKLLRVLLARQVEQLADQPCGSVDRLANALQRFLARRVIVGH